MPETPHLFTEVALLRDQVDDLAKSVSALTRHSEVKTETLKALEKDPMLAKVFLLVDGTRTQNDIVGSLQANGDGGSQATVSRKLEVLIEDLDLVRTTKRTTGGTQYVHTQLARDLKIRRALEKAMPAKTTAKATPKKLDPA